MTEVMELVAVDNAKDEKADDKCPFCYKKPHEFASKKGNPKKIVSKPKSLGCTKVSGEKAGSHTTAQHHLICAIQCFAKVRRLARMATMIGYDINAKPNGLGLPSFKNKYRAYPTDPLRKYSELEEGDKQRVAFDVMERTKAQWHVGHHGFEINLPASWSEEWDPEEFGDDDEVGHTVSYDSTVIEELYDLQTKWVKSDVCADPKDNSEGLKKDLDELSTMIKEKLQAFAKSPSSSAPFYVSERAFEFAVDRDGE